MSAYDKITKARAGLILDHPFFGSLALRMVIKEDPSCPTAWVDGITMGYNPEFIENLTLEATKGLICHEVMHLACAHHARRGERNPRRFNMAGDMAINPILLQAGFVLPEGGLNDPSFHNMPAEEIYSKLPDEQEGGENGEGQNSDPGGCGEVRDSKGPDGQPASPSDLSQAEQEWKVAVAQAAQQAKAAGALPTGLERLVGEILEPKVDWKEALRRFVDTAAKSDYSWTSPSKRFIQQGIYMPSLHSEELGEIVVAIDTSGSVTDEELAQFASEISAILDDYNGAVINVLYCDTKVYEGGVFTKDDSPITLEAKGGGGTDYRPVFSHIEDSSTAPVCLVYLTDGHCSGFPDYADYPVLWVHTGRGGTEPPFGDVVKIG